MLHRISLLFLVVFSGSLFAESERLSLNAYPSTYLTNCEGVAYIYKAKNKLHLGIRAVKNCRKIEVDGLVQNMKKYDLGYRFETVVSSSELTRITVRSRDNNYQDHFVIGGRKSVRPPPTPSEPQNRSLQVLKYCGDSFKNASMRNYCHETLKGSGYDVQAIANLCAEKPYVSAQKNCLQYALKFRYEPIEVMSECGQYSDRASVVKKCYDISLKYKRSPLAILGQCRALYERTSLRFECLERFVSDERPVRSIGLLGACKDIFTRNSVAETCYDKVSRVKMNRKKTLLACANGFDRTSLKFQCLDLAANIRNDPAGVVKECSNKQSRASESLSCIAGFASNRRN